MKTIKISDEAHEKLMHEKRLRSAAQDVNYTIDSVILEILEESKLYVDNEVQDEVVHRM
jgi:predicted CopG family antitoxin